MSHIWQNASPRAPLGVSLLELMFALGLGVTLTGTALPLMLSGLDEVRAASAAWHMAGRFRLARMEAVKRTAAVGFRFEQSGEDVLFTLHSDGNGNGLRTADIRDGVDAPLGPPERIDDKFPGVRFGFVPGVLGVENNRPLPAQGDPVQFGTADIVSFTPSGTATAGTLYVRGRRSGQYAIRVLGATGRTRILQFNFGGDEWITR